MEDLERLETPAKASMMTVPRHSLLGLPAELRLTICRRLFEGRNIRVMTTWWDDKASQYIPGMKAVDGESIMIDDGITLACKLLRAEAVPVLRQHIFLHCRLDHIQHPVELVVKSDLLTSIRKAHFVFADLDIPVSQLPNLETLHIEANENLQPLIVDVVVAWATAGYLKGLVEEVKGQLILEAAVHKFDSTLKDPNRKFKIIWRDQLDLLGPGGAPLVEDMWLTFDWDTLEVIEGMEEIQVAFSMMK